MSDAEEDEFVDERPTKELVESRSTLGLPELIAIGVGGMIGGGIFSVLGMAVEITGHAAPLAFLVGSLVALAAGYSYVKLALGFHSDGASFTYLERAFPRHLNIAGIAGWTIIVGYVGTLALYAFTFGAYGAHLLGSKGDGVTQTALSAGILFFFAVVNLLGSRTTGRVEDMVVYTKVLLLAVFAVAGIRSARVERLTPVFDEGITSVFIAGALIFVAFEGFQLITNAVVETRDPKKNIPRGIYGSIIITSVIYVGVAIVAIGNLGLSELVAAEEYALAAAAEPALGRAGTILIDLAALLATSSAINATLFGASRLCAEMAVENRVPAAFSCRNRTNVPWIAVVVITVLSLTFTALSGLETIATFSSLVFLLISIGVSIANYRLRATTRSRPGLIILGVALMLTTVSVLLWYLLTRERTTFYLVVGLLVIIGFIESFYFERVEHSPTSPSDRCGKHS